MKVKQLKQKEHKQEIKINGYSYTLIIQQKNMKRMLIKITPMLDIVIHVPLHFDIDRAHHFLIEKQDWLEKTIEKQKKVYKEMQILSCLERKKIWIKGQLFTFVRTTEINQYFQIDGENIYIPLEMKMDDKFLERMRVNLYPQLEKKFEEIKLIYLNYLYMLNLSLPSHQTIRLTLKHMKSKWGMCNYQTGEITINKKLVHVPESLLEYVFIHELAHLLYPNHKKDFYQIVTFLYPNYKDAERKLRSYNFILVKDKK